MIISNNERYFKNWMEIYYDDIKDKKLYELKLPGTHDSTTYTLNSFKKILAYTVT